MEKVLVRRHGMEMENSMCSCAVHCLLSCLVFFSSRRRHTRFSRDWSSDVCSSDLLIVVEHDEDTIRSADWIVDIGPRAGEHGGQIVVSGPLSELLASEESLTGAYLTGRESIPVPARRRKVSRGKEVVVKGAAQHTCRASTS